jgi:aminopeptidase-like protein
MNDDEVGLKMYKLMEDLYPICRSITGDGVRETLEIIKKNIPLEIFEVPTGTKVFDWEVPKEWNINDAYVISPSGEKIIDFKESNLHIVNYSIPIRKKISLNELKKHLHSIPEKPNTIPYLTSYYKEDWGFCIQHNKFQNLEDGDYDVVIDSDLSKGNLTYGEFFIKGETENEILISTYVCHPSMCNDNLSGVVLATFIAKYLNSISNFYSIRFLFIPETIGAITWLAKNEKNTKKIKHGLVITCIGDDGEFTYKKSKKGNSEIDKISEYALETSKYPYKIIDFYPVGSDERQYCSPGFNLPVGSLMRTMYGEFLEYHTSDDDLNFIKSKSLQESFEMYKHIINLINKNKKFLNLNPKCEPQLGKRGLYNSLGAQQLNAKGKIIDRAYLCILNYSDGGNSLLDIVEKSKISFEIISSAAERLLKANLIKEI